MRSQVFWLVCLLLPCSLAGGPGEAPEINVERVEDGIVLKCGSNSSVQKGEKDHESQNLHLTYADENSGEYFCSGSSVKLYVKFRTCENCIDLDEASIFGLVIGNVMATIAIGVAVYLTASYAQTSPITSHKKSSDRQPPVPNEASSRAPNDHYQRLRLKGGQKDMYDVIKNRK